MTFLKFMEKFPTENSVIEYFLKIRYPNGVFCNHCGSTKVYQEHSRRKVFSCNDCHSTFSPFKGTIFEKSSTDLRKWMYAIHLFLNGEQEISGLQLQREIGVTYKTAWRMLQQIRLAMGNAENEEFFDTIVAIDDTYIDGKPHKNNDHEGDNKPSNKCGCGKNQTSVIGVIDKNNKKIYTKIAMLNGDGKKLTATRLMDILKVVSKQDNGDTISDEFRGYNLLSKKNFVLLRADHQKAFSDHNGTHINDIENFWATLKRDIHSIYHNVFINIYKNMLMIFVFVIIKT